jgi:hypothetical protein
MPAVWRLYSVVGIGCARGGKEGKDGVVNENDLQHRPLLRCTVAV